MNDNMIKGFDQVAAFQKLWTNSKIAKVDQRLAQRKNTTERQSQTSKSKAQKPAASTGAKHSSDK